MVRRIGSFLAVLLLVSQVAHAQVTVRGTAPPGQAPLDNPLMCGGSDGTNARYDLLDTSGRMSITGQGADAAALVGLPVTIAGSDGSNTRYVGVNPVHQVNVNTEAQDTTYTATALGFAPVANATDFASLTGSGTKTVRIVRIRINGVSTSGAAPDVVVIKRSTANSSGTPTTLTAVPHDANNAAATATAVTYGANPTTGTAIGNIGVQKLGLPAVTVVPTAIEWRPSSSNDQAWVLRGTSQVIALNWNAAALPAGTSLDIEIEWRETSY